MVELLACNDHHTAVSLRTRGKKRRWRDLLTAGVGAGTRIHAGVKVLCRGRVVRRDREE